MPNISSMAESPVPPSTGRTSATARSWFATLTLFLSLWFLLLAGQESCYERALRIGATVIEKGHTPGSSGTGGTRTSSAYWVRYRFTTPEGAVKEHIDSEVLPEAWRELEAGGPVEIEYMPSLADSRVAGQRASPGIYLSIAIVLLVAGIALRRRAS